MALRTHCWFWRDWIGWYKSDTDSILQALTCWAQVKHDVGLSIWLWACVLCYISQNVMFQHYTAVDGLFQSLVGWMEKNSMRWYPAGGMLTFRRELSYKTLAKERRPITQWGCYEQAVDELANSCQNLKLHQVKIESVFKAMFYT